MHLHHLALGARDVGAVARFYEGAFQLRKCAQHHYENGQLRSVWLDLGGAVLMIEETPDSPSPTSTVGAGLFLLAFQVTEPQRLEVEQRLVQLGSAIESRTEFSSYSRDPEGNRIAISFYPLAASLPAP